MRTEVDPTVRSGGHRRADPPVFLLGLHRTGSTWLHAMLAQTGCFRVLTAHHVIHWDEYLSGPCNREPSRERLAARFRQLGLTNRVIDAVEVNPRLPEEYGFILDRVGAGLKTRASNVVWLSFLIDLLANEDGTTGQVLLKNPWDFGRAHLIKRFIPEAKIIYIHRHPADVFDSMFRMVSSLTTTPNGYLSCLSGNYASVVANPFPLAVARWLFNGHRAAPARLIIKHLARETHRYLQSRAQIPNMDYVEVKYESLCRQPKETLDGILSWLGLDRADDDIGEMVSPSGRPRLDSFPEAREMLAEKLSAYCRALGYEWEAISGRPCHWRQ